ncbi:NigD-like C-terminal domain-containing protein [uncultured Sunxiuqinia sp.]|jgi:putative nigrescin immunity protein NigD|uniref:hypothetical protein n=1 Tax=uncultured Sunxiuqinia sp. TaxID=1573825 RepID=UPI0030D7D43B|tara:strand:+ start:16189 stop:16653 length:465 start_codon:yes stop_codon:yes gene_type:complete
MNKFWLILFLAFFWACTEEQDTPDFQLQKTDISDYVDLNVFNYDSLKNDPVTINTVKVKGDLLIVNLSYGGGCKEHIIDLAHVHPSCGTPPLPPPSFQIRHNANNDACEAWISETLQFDISRLRESGESPVTFLFSAAGYGDEHFQKELSYEFE